MLDLCLRNGEVVRNALQEHQLRLRQSQEQVRQQPLSDRVIALPKAIQQAQSEKAGIFSIAVG